MYYFGCKTKKLKVRDFPGNPGKRDPGIPGGNPSLGKVMYRVIVLVYMLRRQIFVKIYLLLRYF